MRSQHGSRVAFVVLLVSGIVVATSAVAEASGRRREVIRVPQDAATIQEAVDVAEADDLIAVAPGRFCGAVIDHEVHLAASWATTIIGCPELTISSGLRVGFLIEGDDASGTSIHGFHFDGRGISDEDMEPLAFAVFGRNVHGVVIGANHVDGTVQAITNSGGDAWTIVGNVIRDLTLFACRTRCGGGAAIVLQQRDFARGRDCDNVVVLNQITGALPDEFDVFDMVGVVVYGQDTPIVAANRFYLPDNETAAARAIGVLVSDVCCGDPAPFRTTRRARIIGNDGERSELVVVVERDAGGGVQNSRGAIIVRNLGVSIINGVRSVLTSLAPADGEAPAAAWPFDLD
jgi:hypothetical protein